MNTITIIGNLGRDADYSQTAQGMAICRFSVASTNKVKDRETTSWIPCTAFGVVADKLRAKLIKGARVSVMGRLEVNPYTDKDGNKRQSYSVITSWVVADSYGYPEGYEAQPPKVDANTSTGLWNSDANPSVPFGGNTMTEDDIPF